MGNKSGDSWLNAVKKAFRSPTNEDEKKKKRSSRRRTEDEEKKSGKKRWIFGRHLSAEKTIQHNAANSSAVSGEENLVRKHPKMEGEGEHKHALAVAMEIIRLTRPALLLKQDKAALFIQKIFRGYLAVIRGHNVRKRAKMTLQCIQSLVRVQSIVCDQRRRLSCEAATLDSKFTQSYRVSNPSDVGPTELEKIHALIHKAKQCSLKQSNTLANALSKQIWATEDEDSSRNTGYSWMRKDRNLCNQRDPIKTIEVDYMFNVKRLNIGLQSPRTPKTRPIPCYQQDAAESPCSRRMSMSDRSCPLPRPNYMAATASAIARVRPNSAPRYRQSSPSREVAKKRLYFHDHDFEDQSNYQRCRDKPCYATD
ncbi:protein IQ-DOMAIN 17-like isoform X2 [Salvia splendens]|uniref:protein IQ-DOMAIN 17-like isoform X2 n=1 Tax=Salvia splendens TaxID=180675 RepID=UPI001C25B8B9|nr:protein IQ-DOMAIN 17-like isoform X2 [Salvia splendens]